LKKLFPHFYEDTDFDFEPLWQDAIFAFDTNVLLNLYVYHATARKEWFDILKKLKTENRLFMPYQVAYEYHLGIAGRIDKARKAGVNSSDLKCEIQSVNELLKNSVLMHSKDVLDSLEKKQTEAQKKITDIAKQFENELSTQIDKWKSQFESDWKSTRDSLAEAFSECTANSPPPSTISARCDDAEKRYSQNIPPGYKDASKREAEFGNKYGDALIWFELMDAAKLRKKNLIFVTFDSKGDWWDKGHEGHSKPRKELINEMTVKSGTLFHLSTAKRFADWMRTTIGATEALAEVERIEEQSVAINLFSHHLGNDLKIEFGAPHVGNIWQTLTNDEKSEVLIQIDMERYLGRKALVGEMYRVDAITARNRLAAVYVFEDAQTISIWGLRSVPRQQ